MLKKTPSKLCNWCEIKNKKTYTIINYPGKFNNKVMCIYCLHNKKRRISLYKLRTLSNKLR